jgi:hypothetical protein
MVNSSLKSLKLDLIKHELYIGAMLWHCINLIRPKY